MRSASQPYSRRVFRGMTDALPPKARRTPLLLRLHGGQQVNELQYKTLDIEIGGVLHKFALHKYAGEWRVTDIASGLRVISVQGYLHGSPVSASTGFSADQIRQLAIKQVHALAARIGVEAFNYTVIAGVPKNVA